MRRIRWVKRQTLIETYYAREVDRGMCPNRALLHHVNRQWRGALWQTPQDEYDAHHDKGTWTEVIAFPIDTPLAVMKKTMRAMLYLGMDTGV